ncbi:MAG: AzlD domain-containing protein [Phyllobacteriaceae bacterium]|nr:AzlD domain-containing protein [Phyllobacteriaceae bacterium]
MTDTVFIIVSAAALTYATRFGGHAVLSRFRTLHPRVDAALNAVPAAVLTTLIAPAAAQGGPAELASLALMAALSTRVSMLTAFLIAAAMLVGARQMGF